MLPLSSSQEIVWLHEQMQPGSRAYNFTASLDLWGTLDTEALRRGLDATLARHPGLRLELVASAGSVPAQRVAPRCAPRLHTVDLATEEDPEAAFARLLRTEAETPLDTFEAPLIRWTLVRLAERHHRLIHVEHHLIHDGHSFAILLDDVFRVYRAHVLGETLTLPPASSYADHVLERTEAAYASESLDFWRAELQGQQHDLPLPGLTRPGARRKHHGGQLRQTIGADLAERLRAHARSRGLTPSPRSWGCSPNSCAGTAAAPGWSSAPRSATAPSATRTPWACSSTPSRCRSPWTAPSPPRTPWTRSPTP